MKGLERIFRKTAALIMALVMCLTLVPDVTIFAADEDTYTVNLSDCEGGRIAFSDDDGSVSKSFAAGSTVSVQLISDDGYEVAGFGIYEAVNGEELYLTETTDDIFEFTMPDESVTLKADFAQVSENTTGAADTESSETESADAAKETDGADDAVVVEDIPDSHLTFVGHAVYSDLATTLVSYIQSIAGDRKGVYKDKDCYYKGNEYVCADLVSDALVAAGVLAPGDRNSRVSGLESTLTGKYGWTTPYVNVNHEGTTRLDIYPGDIIVQSYNGDRTHIMYVADVDVSNSKIYVASATTGYIKYLSLKDSFYNGSSFIVEPSEVDGDIVLEEIENTEGLTEGEDYFSVSEETFDSVREQIESGELSSIDDVEIALQGADDRNEITVLRLPQTPPTSSFVISKNDGSVGNEYATATYENAALKSTGKVSCSDIAASNPNYGSLADARFSVMYADKTPVDVYTDPECTVLYTDALVAGVTYYLKGDVDSVRVSETTAPKGWTLDTNEQILNLSHNAAVPDTVSFSDVFKGDPLRLTLTKTGSEGTSLSGAQFTLTNTDTGESWVYRTGSDGKIIFNNASYLVSGTVTIEDGEIKFFAGNYTLEETAAPSGYLISGGYSMYDSTYVYANYNAFSEGYKWNIKITSEDGHAHSIINGVNITNDAGMELAIKERAKLVGFELQKENKDTGSATLEGGMTDLTTTFEVIYTGRSGDGNGDDYAWIDYNGNGLCDGDGELVAKGGKVKCPSTGSTTWITDAKGKFSLPALLQAGTYAISEVKAPGGMIMESGDKINFSIGEGTSWMSVADGYIYYGGTFADKTARGGFAGYKYDSDTGLNKAQSGSTFDGLQIWVKNANKNPVWLDINGDGKIDSSVDKQLGVGEEYLAYTITISKKKLF